MSIEEKIKNAKEDSWLKDFVSEEEFKQIKEEVQSQALISKKAVLDKLQEHHDFYINAYGDRFDFRDLAQKDDKARVDEITTIQAFIMELPTIPQADSVLKNIKAEIKEMRSKQNCSCSDCLDIIDKHISELKGVEE